MIRSTATTATGRPTCLSKPRTRASRSNRVRSRAAASSLLAFFALGAADRPVFRSDPVSAPLLSRIRTTTWHPGCPVAPEDLRQLTLSYRDFENKTRTGTLLVHRNLADEVVRLFESLYQKGFQIERMVPIEDYGGNDDASMA